MSDSPRDVVVVGSGHNALVAACYLAKAGRAVTVLEHDTVIGGAVSTVERFPGHRVDRGSSAHVMIRGTGIVEDLELARFGLEYQDLDPWGFAPFPTADGGQEAITFHVDLDTTCASIEGVCGPRDADAYRAFVVDWMGRNELVFAAFAGAPTPGRLARSLWGLGRRTALSGSELGRQFMTSGDALLDSLFVDERLKTALAWFGAQSGPPSHEPATADLVGWAALLHRQAPGHPRGGSGMLTAALAARLRSDGGVVRTGDGVRRVVVENGAVAGVLTESGERIAAPVVVAGCHVLTTLGLLGDAVPAALAERARRFVRTGNGLGMVVRAVTSDLPRYPAAAEDGSTYRAMQLLAPSRQALGAAYGSFLAARTPDRPPALAMTFSAFDDTLAPPGEHNLTVWGQWHPYELAEGSWASIAEREGDKLIEAVDRYAPGFADSVRAVHVQTPPDLERELGLVRGNVMHLDMSLDQMFAWRPLPELAGYRVPGVPGLWLTGASTHPGGGVHGASGRTVARLVLAERATGPIRRLRARLVR